MAKEKKPTKKAPKKTAKEEIPEIKINKKQALLSFVNTINKAAKLEGKAKLQLGIRPLEKMSTGSQLIDTLIGGGVMRGRLMTISGAEKSGKTTFCVSVIAEDQKRDKDGIWLWLDFENAADDKWFRQLGLDPDRILVVNERETMEEYCDVSTKILREGDLINGIVIDSVGAMLPMGEILKKVGKTLQHKSLSSDTIGLLNRKLAQYLRGVKGILAKRNIPMLAITHEYVDISNGGMKIPKGGSAFAHFSDLRIRFRQGQKANAPWNEKNESTGREQLLGFEQVITIDKSKNYDAKPYLSQIALPFIFGKGVSEDRFFVERAIRDGLILKPGSYHYFNEDLSKCDKETAQIKINGRKAFWEFIDQNPEFVKKVREQYKDVDVFVMDSMPPIITAEAGDNFNPTM